MGKREHFESMQNYPKNVEETEQCQTVKNNPIARGEFPLFRNGAPSTRPEEILVFIIFIQFSQPASQLASQPARPTFRPSGDHGTAHARRNRHAFCNLWGCIVEV